MTDVILLQDCASPYIGDVTYQNFEQLGNVFGPLKEALGDAKGSTMILR